MHERAVCRDTDTACVSWEGFLGDSHICHYGVYKVHAWLTKSISYHICLNTLQDSMSTILGTQTTKEHTKEVVPYYIYKGKVLTFLTFPTLYRIQLSTVSTV